MVAFLGWPQAVMIMGHEVPTFLLLMTLFLTICVIMTTTAGQVSVLLTDCAEGMFSQLFYTAIAIALLVMVFDWSITKQVLLAAPAGKSMVNPFDTSKIHHFNLWFVLISMFTGTYRSIAWQNSHAFNSSAASPHEARMGGVLGRWRGFAVGVMITLLSVCAMTYLQTHTAQINAELDKITDPSVRDQMSAPLALTMMLPTGIKGMLLSICLMGIIAGDGIHLHSWGSIFVQDVVLPLRKKPLTPKQHITLLRLSIAGVAVWAWLFGALIPQIKYVQYWWGITEAIFVSGAGIAIIGGLYWSRGNTVGAWAALIIGAMLAFAGIGRQFYMDRYLKQDWIVQVLGANIVINVPLIVFIVTLVAISCYVLLSLLTGGGRRHNMDQLLHRGAYAVEPESEKAAIASAATGGTVIDPPLNKPNLLYRIVTFGIDEQFSRTDRWITISITLWSMTWFTVFCVGTVWNLWQPICTWMHLDHLANLLQPWSNQVWSRFWLVTAIFLPLGIGAVTTVWFTWGCTHDMIVFFKRLNAERVDEHDDGSVRKSGEEELATSARGH
jgi:SSS family solute:Na+ symporter